MKILIVFTALLLVFSMFLIYMADLNDYMRLQKELKILAEDCALAACLCVNQSESNIPEAEARAFAEDIIAKSGLSEKGEILIEAFEITHEGLGASVTLSLSGIRFFRLTFLNTESITRKSEYVWE